MTVSDKISKFLKSKGMSQQELADKLGVTQSTVSLWIREDRVPASTSRKKLCEFMGISESELFSDKVDADTKPVRRIPVIDCTAESPEEYIYDSASEEHKNIVAPFDIDDPHAFSITMDDDSMSPRYIKGDCIIAGYDSPVKQGSPALVKIIGSDIICRTYKESGSEVFLIPANLQHEIQTYHKSKVAWAYPVIGMCRKEG